MPPPRSGYHAPPSRPERSAVGAGISSRGPPRSRASRLKLVAIPIAALLCLWLALHRALVDRRLASASHGVDDIGALGGGEFFSKGRSAIAGQYAVRGFDRGINSNAGGGGGRGLASLPQQGSKR